MQVPGTIPKLRRSRGLFSRRQTSIMALQAERIVRDIELSDRIARKSMPQKALALPTVYGVAVGTLNGLDRTIDLRSTVDQRIHGGDRGTVTGVDGLTVTLQAELRYVAPQHLRSLAAMGIVAGETRLFRQQGTVGHLGALDLTRDFFMASKTECLQWLPQQMRIGRRVPAVARQAPPLHTGVPSHTGADGIALVLVTLSAVIHQRGAFRTQRVMDRAVTDDALPVSRDPGRQKRPQLRR
jgi:hypothetical protein